MQELFSELECGVATACSTPSGPEVPQNCVTRRMRRPRWNVEGKDCNGNEKKHNSSLWNLKENLAYAEFLREEGHLYALDREKLKVLKINVRMSKVVKTRSADQCRSHHQKMMKYHGSIPSIIRHVQNLRKLELDLVDRNEHSSISG